MLDFFKLSLSEARFRLASDRSLKVCYEGTLANLEGASVHTRDVIIPLPDSDPDSDFGHFLYI